MEETIKIHRKKNHGMVFALVAPTALWLVFFLLIPLVYVVSMSFMEKGLYGGVESVFTLENYRHIFKDIYMKDLEVRCHGISDQPYLPFDILSLCIRAL